MDPVYISKRWSASTLSSAQSAPEYRPKKGRGTVDGHITLDQNSNNSAVEATDSRGPWDIAFGDFPVTVGGLTRSVVAI